MPYAAGTRAGSSVLCSTKSPVGSLLDAGARCFWYFIPNSIINSTPSALLFGFKTHTRAKSFRCSSALPSLFTARKSERNGQTDRWTGLLPSCSNHQGCKIKEMLHQTPRAAKLRRRGALQGLIHSTRSCLLQLLATRSLTTPQSPLHRGKDLTFHSNIVLGSRLWLFLPPLQSNHFKKNTAPTKQAKMLLIFCWLKNLKNKID